LGLIYIGKEEEAGHAAAADRSSGRGSVTSPTWR